MSPSKIFEYLFVENFFSDAELSDIREELENAYSSNLFGDDVGVGLLEGKELKSVTTKSGFFVDDVDYSFVSKTYKAVSKLFSDGFTLKFSKLCFAAKPVLVTKKHNLLFSLYNDGGFYLPHRDHAITSVLFWFCREPQNFTGGDLYFEELGETVKFKNNSMLMFPSQALHEVTPVKIIDKNLSPLHGRFCITMFLL